MATPKEEIQKELKIGHTQYYSYIDAAEQLVDDFMIGMVDHGLVLQFSKALKRIRTMTEKSYDNALDAQAKISEILKSDDKSELNSLNNVIRIYNNLERTYNDFLDDSKIVHRAIKTIKKVMVQNAQSRK